jgi:hypothetical protein
MILFIEALYKEAAPLIQALSLKRDPACTAFQRFAGEDVTLYLSGTGESAAACCAGFALGREENVSHLVNLGAAAGPAGTKGMLFRILSLEDSGSGKRYYPDLLLAADLRRRRLSPAPGPWEGRRCARQMETPRAPSFLTWRAPPSLRRRGGFLAQRRSTY